MTTTENNKLIAEFMDLTIKEGVCYYTDADDMYPMGIEVEEPYIPYDESWDWLMKVVDKIESLGIVSFEKNLQEEGDYQCLFTKGYDILICHYADTSIEATYNAVIEFINFYNNK